MDEESLDIDALRAGDASAFKLLIKRYHGLLIAIVRPMVGDGVAEEIVQNVWIKVYESIDGFQGRSQLKTWISSIALNEARMYLRKHKQELASSQSLDTIDPLADRFKDNGSWKNAPSRWVHDSPDELLMQDNLLDCISKTLALLPAGQQSLVRLRDLEGLSFETICNELEISSSNARVLLHRARGELYRMLEHYEETGEC